MMVNIKISQENSNKLLRIYQDWEIERERNRDGRKMNIMTQKLAILVALELLEKHPELLDYADITTERIK